jgi:hypothetical protein
LAQRRAGEPPSGPVFSRSRKTEQIGLARRFQQGHVNTNRNAGYIGGVEHNVDVLPGQLRFIFAHQLAYCFKSLALVKKHIDGGSPRVIYARQNSVGNGWQTIKADVTEIIHSQPCSSAESV